MELKKATLREISSDNPPRDLGQPIPVQFNPTTLRLQLANRIEGGQSRGRQVRQFTGSSSTSLTLDLVFDTADEGSDESPRSVREKTALLEKFVLPRGEGRNKQAPPKVRFHWGRLIIEGLIESVDIDFDHFAADGTPLRAKVGVTIKEQNSRYQYLEAGAGANTARNTPTPNGSTAGAPGSSGSGGDRSALSLAGESVADFAARVGVDPAAWRAMAGGLNATVSLRAGLEIGFDTAANLGAGFGASLGVQAGTSLSLEASLGLAPGVSAVPGVGAETGLAAGFRLSAAGGVGPALESVKIARSDMAEQRSRKAFEAPPAHAAAGGAPSAPLRPRADPRATSFAFGVPLRPSVGAAAKERSGTIQGAVPLRPKTASGDPPLTDDPTTPGWLALPEPAATVLMSRDRARRAGRCACGRFHTGGRPCRSTSKK